uniref:Uncharacterized protein n=1 Tax=Steinernema glaseri TaxID=37863 RepID=A0A1I7YGE8_9BILA
MPLFARIASYFMRKADQPRSTSNSEDHNREERRKRRRKLRQSKELPTPQLPTPHPVAPPTETNKRAEGAKPAARKPRKGDAVYPPSLRKANPEKGKTSAEPVPKTVESRKEESKKDQSESERSSSSRSTKSSGSSEKTVLADDFGDVLTRDDVNQLMAELKSEHKKPHDVVFDPWADLDVLRERSNSIFSAKAARLDLEFESQRSNPFAFLKPPAVRPSISESVLRRTYSVRDRSKVTEEKIPLNDKSPKPPK